MTELVVNSTVDQVWLEPRFRAWRQIYAQGANRFWSLHHQIWQQVEQFDAVMDQLQEQAGSCVRQRLELGHG